MKETPFQIIPNRNIEGIEIRFENIRELCQGGPEIGQLLINGARMSSDQWFGGPIMINDRSIIAPVYTRSFLKSGFRISMINIDSKEIKYISKIYPLINLISITEKKVIFTTDLDNKSLKEVSITVS